MCYARSVVIIRRSFFQVSFFTCNLHNKPESSTVEHHFFRLPQTAAYRCWIWDVCYHKIIVRINWPKHKRSYIYVSRVICHLYINAHIFYDCCCIYIAQNTRKMFVFKMTTQPTTIHYYYHSNIPLFLFSDSLKIQKNQKWNHNKITKRSLVNRKKRCWNASHYCRRTMYKLCAGKCNSFYRRIIKTMRLLFRNDSTYRLWIRGMQDGAGYRWGIFCEYHCSTSATERERHARVGWANDFAIQRDRTKKFCG